MSQTIAADSSVVPKEQSTVASVHAPPPGERRYPIQFTGTIGEYFRIWIVNLGLTLATLGIYSAWAKVRKRRYLYGHTCIDGEGFEYRAKPLAILKGRLIALGLLVALIVTREFLPATPTWKLLARLILFVVLAIAGPWFIVKSLKFNANNTTYRNIRFRFIGTYAGCLKIVAAFWWLPLMPLAYPYLKRRLVHFAAENHYYGTTRFTVLDFKKPFIHAYGLAYGLAFLGVLLVAIGSRGRQDFIAIGIYAALFLSLACIHAWTSNAVWNNIQVGTIRIESVLRARDLIWLYLSNAGAIIVTVGLATPWAVIRTHRYRASMISLIALSSLDVFLQGEVAQVAAVGEEVAELFDLDIAL